MSDSDAVVFVVDDEPAVLKGLTRLLRSAGFQALPFSSPLTFLDCHDPNQPGCAVVDLAMPQLNGLELQAALAGAGYERPLVFLSGRGDIAASVRAMKAGAEDFLTKPVNDEDLLAAVRRAIERDRIIRLALAQSASIGRRLATLTRREREVLSGLVRGRLNKQIAGDLGVVEKTIKVHRGRLMEKMEARSLLELAHMVEGIDLLADMPDSVPGATRPPA
jgi:FixJ family two-component response regulator